MTRLGKGSFLIKRHPPDRCGAYFPNLCHPVRISTDHCRRAATVGFFQNDKIGKGIWQRTVRSASADDKVGKRSIRECAQSWNMNDKIGKGIWQRTVRSASADDKVGKRS